MDYSLYARQLPLIVKSRNMDDGFYCYLETIKMTKSPYFKFIQFQIDDFYMMLKYVETALIRTRRGGKSRDLSIIAVFFAILGFEVIWLAASSTQLRQARKYLLANPYVAKVKIHTIETLNGVFFELSMITKGRVASSGCRIIIFDEGGKINVNLLEYEYYTYSRAMLAENTTGFYRIIHGSTPCLGTAIEEVYRDLLESNPKAISHHPYTDCPWISPAFVAEEERKYGKWYVDQEYRALFVPHGGQLLSNIKIIDVLPEFPEVDFQRGADLNVTITLVSIYVVGDDCYVMDEKELDWFQDGQRVEMEHYLQTSSIEMESEGFNYYQARDWSRLYSNLIYVQWSKENKGRRLIQTRQFKNIFISPKKTPLTYSDLASAISHPTENIWLKDIRHPSHWTDAFFHAVGAAKQHVFPVAGNAKVKTLQPAWRKR